MSNIPISRLTAKLHLLSTGEGGRETAIRENVYRPQFHLGSSSASCRVDVIEGDAILPGEEGAVEMTLLHPERFGAELRRGGQFEIHEGARVVGWGIIDEVRQQKAPPPLIHTNRREQILSLLRESGGLSRKELLERMGLKGDKRGAASVSNALTILTKSNRVRREDGKYYPAGKSVSIHDSVSSHL